MQQDAWEKDFLEKKRALFSQYYQFLNQPQKDAVACVKGPLLVLAGAGSGKTTVLVNRIGNLILFGNAWQSEELPPDAKELYPLLCEADGGSRAHIRSVLERLAEQPAQPYRVLCITFTNKAANEFKERLSTLLGERSREIWAGTFHSVCVRILRRFIDRLGYTGDFTIYDTDDVKKVIAQIMKQKRIDEKLLSVKAMMGLISKQKERGLTPDDLSDIKDAGGYDARMADVEKVYAAYQTELKNANALDFDDLIMLTERLLRECPDVLEIYRRQFDYILVDEFQDTNPLQNRLVLLLAGEKQNVCVVGDDDQSIYSFRGATVENILKFDQAFRNAKVIRLEQNYRSTGHILSAANAVIAHNLGRKGKNLWTASGDGDLITVENPQTQAEESALLIASIKKQVASGEYRYGDFAVLYRMGALSNNIEQMLVKNRIPYRICGGLRFNERREIKDVIAYLSVVANPSDPVRLKRILNVPKRSIGDTTVSKIEDLALSEGKSLFEIASHADAYPSLAKSVSKLQGFTSLIRSMREFSAEHGLKETVQYILDVSGYLRFLSEEAEADGDESHEREQNVREFLSTVQQFEETAESPTLNAFLEEMALVSDVDTLEEGQDAVTLMTVHASKGLEFPVVFLIGFEDGLFPSMQALTEGGVEEERRLAYVAITRAKRKLVVTHCASRMLYGRTEARVASRFLSEFPEQDCDIVCHEREYGADMGERYPSYAERREQAAKAFAGVAAHVVQREEKRVSERFGAGERVCHPFFGAGEILSSQDMGGDMLYEIQFDSGSVKRIMGSYAKLKREGKE